MQEPTLTQRTAALLRGADLIAIRHRVRPAQWLPPTTESFDYDGYFSQRKDIPLYRCWSLNENGKRAIRAEIADHFSGKTPEDFKQAWLREDAICEIQEEPCPSENQP